MNTITIELCAEDRARLDRLAEAMEKRACDSCVTSALEIMKGQQPDPVQKALAETLAKAEKPAEVPKTAPEATEAETLPTTPEKKEEPTAATGASDAPPLTLEQIQQGNLDRRDQQGKEGQGPRDHQLLRRQEGHRPAGAARQVGRGLGQAARA